MCACIFIVNQFNWVNRNEHWLFTETNEGALTVSVCIESRNSPDVFVAMLSAE